MDLTGESNRTAGKDFATAISLSWDGLLSLVKWVKPEDNGWWDGVLFLGWPMVLLGIWRLLFLKEARMRALLALTLFALILALGPQTAVFDLVYAVTPGMGSFRFNNRFGMFAVFALVLGAALAWPAIVSRLRFHNNSEVLQTLIKVAWVALWLLAFMPDIIHYSKDFGRFAIRYTDGESVPEDIQRMLGPRTEAAPQRWFVADDLLKANSGMVNGYSMVKGNVALSSARVWRYLHYAAGTRPDKYQVTYVLDQVHAHGPFPYKGANILVGWKAKEQLLALCPPIELGSRAWLVRNLVPVADSTHALKEMVVGFDPRKSALVEPDAYSGAKNLGVGEVQGAAKVLAFSRNTVVVHISNSTPALLVLAEAWYPGWQATVDQSETDVFPVNVWMRGTFVPAGDHQVVFTYRSPFLVLGVVISLTAILTWLWAWRVFRLGRG